jgi:hypothetical protein
VEHAIEHGYANGRFGILTSRASCTQGGADDALVATHRRLDTRDFSIRVFEMPDGKYFCELSHYYWGPNQGGPYISSRTETGNTIQEVVESELRKLRTYYDDKDPAGKVVWQKGYRLDEFVDAYGHDLTREEAQQRHSSK